MHNRKFRQKRSLVRDAYGIFILAAFAIGMAVFSTNTGMVSPVAALAKDCNIKGNISIGSGEHIYHMPGQEDYDATKISPQYGERWFCSEAEARAAGWRKARN